MEAILSELVDRQKLIEYVQSSLGNLDKLRRIGRALDVDSAVKSTLEEELIRQIEHLSGDLSGQHLREEGEHQEYLQWLCNAVDRLTTEKWLAKREILWTCLSDTELRCSGSLLRLAIHSSVVSWQDVLDRVNELPPPVIIRTVRNVHDDKLLLRILEKLVDDTTLVSLLADVMSVDMSRIDVVLRSPDLIGRLNSALEVTLNSDDSSLRRCSLMLLEKSFAKEAVANGELIVNAFSVAEQKQIHLIEPVLTRFVEATRNAQTPEIFWTLQVFRKLFHHQTSWVRTTSTRLFLSLRRYHEHVFTTEGVHFYLNELVEAIDQVSLYARTESCPLSGPSSMGVCLREWLQNLQQDVPADQFAKFLADFLNKICTRTAWNSVALLYVSEALLSLSPIAIITNMQIIQTAICTWSFQESLIRKAIIRLWLQIACELSSDRAKEEGLTQLASQFVEDVECIRNHLTPLNLDPLTPAGFCSLVWSRSQSTEMFLRKNANNPLLWSILRRTLNIESVSTELEQFLRIAEIQQGGLDLMKSSGNVEDKVKNDIVDVLSTCLNVIPPLPTEDFDWRCAYLWSTMKTSDENSDLLPLLERCLLEVNQINDWAKCFSRESIIYVFRTLANVAGFNCCQMEHRKQMLNFACSLLPLIPRQMTADILCLIKANLKALAQNDREKVKRILQMTWTSCLETRKATSTFSSCVRVYMEIMFDETVATSCLTDVLNQCSVMKDYIEGVAWFGEMYFLTMLKLLKKQPQLIVDLRGQLVQGLCYGPIFRKDQRVVLDTERYILAKLGAKSERDEGSKLRRLTECEASLNVRAKCVSFVRTVTSSVGQNLIDAIVDYDKAVSSTRKRYFNNSNIHRVKTRAWQAILVLLDVLEDNPPQAGHFVEDILDQLKNDSHQMTVRIFMEWCAAKLIMKNQLDLFAIISSAIDKASTERIGSICSYLNILMHVCCATNPTELQCDLVKQTIPLTLPWMMAQHFSVRLHSQFIFRRLMQLCSSEANNFCDITYRPHLDALDKVLNYGAGAKTATKIDGDFFMSECILPQCETFDLVFDKIPRAYGLADVDAIPRRLFVLDDSTWAQDSGRDVRTNLSIEEINENCSRPDTVVTVQELNYQRKIMPVNNLLEEDRGDVDGGSSCGNDQLIVVASLIDRLPNLGGICRTAEIFAVSELAVPNIKIVEMKEFHNLSVSAHHWLPMRGVPEVAVGEYLREKKAEGFTLIGVEQTSQSFPLNEFTFPPKSLLLLGSEKEGIPMHLIHEMDFCVEIPQQGVVRSLNVHVSAALFIWEYRKQRLAANANA